MDSKNSATGNIEDDKELLAKARKALLQNQDDPSKIKSAKIVKFIFENVYQGIKDDLSEDDGEMERILMKRLKKVLLSSTEELVTKVYTNFLYSSEMSPKDNLSQRENSSFAENRRPSFVDSKGECDNGVDWITKSTRSKFRACRIHHLCQTPEFYIKVLIPTSVEDTKRSRGKDDFIKYRIEAQAFKFLPRELDVGNMEQVLTPGLKFVVERSHDEIKKLFLDLTAKFADIVIPPPPTKYQMEHGCQTINDSKVEFRTRNYQLWFEYICNIHALQESQLLIAFMTGGEAWTKSATPQQTDLQINYIQAGVRQEGIMHAFQYRENDRDYTPYPNKDVACRVGDLFPKTSCELCDEYIFIFKTKSFQDLMTIKRDLENLSINAPYIISACRSYMSYLSCLQAARTELVQYVDKKFEHIAEDGEEYKFLLALSKTLLSTNQYLLNHAEILCYSILEPAQLLYGPLLSNTLKIVEKHLKAFQLYILPSISAPTPQPESRWERREKFSTITKEQEKDYLHSAGTLARSWDASFKVRSAILINRLIEFGKQSLTQHVQTRKEWENVLFKLGGKYMPYEEQRKRELDRLPVHRTDSQASYTGMDAEQSMESSLLKSNMYTKELLRSISHQNYDANRSSIPANEGDADDIPPTPNKAKSAASVSTESGIQSATASASVPPTVSKVKKVHRTNKITNLQSTVPPHTLNPPVSSTNPVSSNLFSPPAFKPPPPPRRDSKPTVEDLPEPEPIPQSFHSHNHHFSAQTSGPSFHSKGPVDELPPQQFSNGGSNHHEQSRKINHVVSEHDHDHDQQQLPDGWEKAVSPTGQTYYYHKVTRVTRWNFPTETKEKSKSVVDTKEKSKSVVDPIEEAVQKRKIQWESEKKAEEHRLATAELYKRDVKEAIEKWKKTNVLGKTKDIGEMLMSLHLIINSISKESITTAALSSKSDPNEIKRAFMKAARQLHPDKLGAELLVEEKLLAEEVFITLTEEYNNYKRMKNLV